MGFTESATNLKVPFLKSYFFYYVEDSCAMRIYYP